MCPEKRIRIVTSGPSMPIRITGGGTIPNGLVTGGPSDPVRIVKHGASNPVKGKHPLPPPVPPAPIELITNGTFVANANDWTGNNANLSANNGHLRVTATGSSVGSAWQQIAAGLVIGKTYRLTYEFVGKSVGTYANFQMGADVWWASNYYYTGAHCVVGTFTVTFIATSVDAFIQASVHDCAAGSYAEFGNISLVIVP